jgi:hypothetical protein
MGEKEKKRIISFLSTLSNGRWSIEYSTIQNGTAPCENKLEQNQSIKAKIVE